MIDMGYQVDEVDAITGPAMGRPKSASFGTADLVGLDTIVHVVRQRCARSCTDDEGQRCSWCPPSSRRWSRTSSSAARPKAGFFKREKGPKGENIDYTLDWKTGRVPPEGQARRTVTEGHQGHRGPRRANQGAGHAADRAGEFAWRMLTRRPRLLRRGAWARSPTTIVRHRQRASSGASTGSSVRSRPGTRSASRTPSSA